MHGGTLLLFSSPLATSNDKILPFKQTRQICVVLGTHVNANSKFLSYFWQVLKSITGTFFGFNHTKFSFVSDRSFTCCLSPY